jgi:DNA mismatch endonuclease (patch repair protein)
MADVHSRKIRSYNMSRIKGKDTKPELIVRKFLFSKGFRYRLHTKKLPSKPDIVLPKYNTVIFIHGCFWHGHEGCRYFVVPKTRTEWWLNKIHNNTTKDSASATSLREAGWKVLTIWECDLRKNTANITLDKLLLELHS